MTNARPSRECGKPGVSRPSQWLQDFLSPEQDFFSPPAAGVAGVAAEPAAGVADAVQDFLSPEQDFFSVAAAGSAAAGVLPPQAAIVPISIPATADTARALPMFIEILLTLRTRRKVRPVHSSQARNTRAEPVTR